MAGGYIFMQYIYFKYFSAERFYFGDKCMYLFSIKWNKALGRVYRNIFIVTYKTVCLYSILTQYRILPQQIFIVCYILDTMLYSCIFKKSRGQLVLRLSMQQHWCGFHVCVRNINVYPFSIHVFLYTADLTYFVLVFYFFFSFILMFFLDKHC